MDAALKCQPEGPLCEEHVTPQCPDSGGGHGISKTVQDEIHTRTRTSQPGAAEEDWGTASGSPSWSVTLQENLS